MIPTSRSTSQICLRNISGAQAFQSLEGACGLYTTSIDTLLYMFTPQTAYKKLMESGHWIAIKSIQTEHEHNIEIQYINPMCRNGKC